MGLLDIVHLKVVGCIPQMIDFNLRIGLKSFFLAIVR